MTNDRILQERARDEPIPELSSNSGDSMTPRLLLNSTKPKDYARNAREEEVCGVCVCVCVLFSTPPPSIYSREPPAAAPQTELSSEGAGADAGRGEGEAAVGLAHLGGIRSPSLVPRLQPPTVPLGLSFTARQSAG